MIYKKKTWKPPSNDSRKYRSIKKFNLEILIGIYKNHNFLSFSFTYRYFTEQLGKLFSLKNYLTKGFSSNFFLVEYI